VAQTSSVEIGPATRKGDLVFMRGTTHASIRRGASRDPIYVSLALPHTLDRRVPANSYGVPLRRVQNGDVT
jgi:hypothetical protein